MKQFFSFNMKKKVKCKIGHGKSEEKGEFGSPRSELNEIVINISKEG